MTRILAAAALAAAVLCAGTANAQTELVTNGSFEAGTTGWTVTGNCIATALPSSNRYSGSGVPSPSGPTDGANYVELTPSGGSQTCYLYQDIAIPAGQTAQLTVSASAGFSQNTAAYIGAFRVLTTADAVLATPFVRDGTQPPSADLAPYSADLSAYAGQTIRLAVQMTNGPTCCNVTFADKVSVLAAPAGPRPVPTLSEWAMILFGTLLAGGAAVVIQRRRLA